MVQSRILIADDSPTIRDILKFGLESEGYEVVTAFDGVDAIEQAYKYAPDIILLDIMMPRMNGYQTCRLLKSDIQTSDIPVVMLTAQDQPKDKFWGLQTGADEYIIKDFDSDEIFESIVKLLKKKKDKKDIEAGQLPKISLDGILSRLNELLDKRLFQATILNEINSIAQSRDSCEEVIKELLYLINKVVNYKVGGALLRKEDESIDLAFYYTTIVDDNFTDEVTTRIIDLAAIEIGSVIDKSNIRVVSFGEKRTKTNPTTEHINSYLSFPLRSHKKVIGILFLVSTEHNAFGGDMPELLSLIANEASVVIDNTMLNDEIKRLSITDGLTKCYNHRHFQDILANEFIRSKRYKLNFSLAIADIDHFKQVNDTYGHQMGDIILKGVVGLLKKSLRDIDFIARYGGEEFAIIMPETPFKGVFDTADRLRRSVENYTFSGLPPGKKITISFGVGTFPDLKVKDQFELINKIDKALYRAKEEGRNKVCPAK